MARKQTAIVDIGSNSVRLVVYAGSRRVPYPVFNEKVLAGLGADLAKTGLIGADAEERALRALRRFKLLIDRLGGARTKIVATAAVRDAANGPEFVARVRSLGLSCRVLTQEEEATLAGLGVVSGIPAADGIVGDLGGGSLELVDVSKGQTGCALSLPFGVLRLGGNGESAMKKLRTSIGSSPLAGLGNGRAFYMVGGSWRALAKLHMAAADYPLPIIHQYRIDPASVAELVKLSRSPQAAKLLSAARHASAPAAAMLLATIVDELQPSEVIASSFGIRDGLLFSTLSSFDRRRDPLLEAVCELSTAEAGFRSRGDELQRWLQGAFDDDPPKLRRIRIAACLLADATRRTVAPFQADRTVEMALHGAWVGLNSEGRVLIAQALSTSFGRNCLPDAALARLANPRDMKRATQWGLAMRLGGRLSAGVSAVLRRTKLSASGSQLQLQIPLKEQDLVNETVLRRLSKLANSLEMEPKVVLT